MLLFAQYKKKDIVDVKKQIDLLKEKENHYEKEIGKLENKITDQENLIRNMKSKLEESSEKIDVLEKKVKDNEQKHEYLESKIEEVKKTCYTQLAYFSCYLCDQIFKTKSKVNEHTAEVHTTRESESENISSVEPSDHDKQFKCNFCNFKSSSENGIKIHTAKKHSNFSERNSHLMNPGQFSPRCSPRMPPRFPPRFPPRYSPDYPPTYPMSPYDV